jgi:hypothetical protein
MLMHTCTFSKAILCAAGTTMYDSLGRLGVSFQEVPLPGPSIYVKPGSVMYTFDGEASAGLKRAGGGSCDCHRAGADACSAPRIGMPCTLVNL